MGSLKGVETLKTRREFDRVYKNGRSYHTPFFVLFHLKADTLRIGFVASKKLGKAVQRNRAKRILRALLLPWVRKLQDGHYVLVAKPLLLTSSFEQLRQVFARVVQRFLK